ncbi:6535_t:CDS:2 [Entrophospora sp. SA101]|nr:1084_t:CDS:2 [Entrophospora sp. SA101]CAJ0634756.1 5877_t:CDS:2 [Entrophospora sp. SA101]CAJ0753974.1 18591_t:CDS:2 [Entrophospora sp. SA101]CAJ0761571.1 6535_t:CDS:2 [Entrophospora sp. SA101]CAJ0841256.1 2233_t:CDS:2 [Entrophospora sp. SA101]
MKSTFFAVLLIAIMFVALSHGYAIERRAAPLQADLKPKTPAAVKNLKTLEEDDNPVSSNGSKMQAFA